MAQPSISPRRFNKTMSLFFVRHAGLSVTAVLLALSFLNHLLSPLFVAVKNAAVEHHKWDVLCLLAVVAAISSGLLSGKGGSRENGRSRQTFDFVIDSKLSTFDGKIIDTWMKDEIEYIGGTLGISEHRQTWSTEGENSFFVEQVFSTSGGDRVQPVSRALEKKSRAAKRPNEITDIDKSSFAQPSGPSTHEQAKFQAAARNICGRYGGEKFKDGSSDSCETIQTNRQSIATPLFTRPSPCALNVAVDLVLHDEEIQVHGPADDDPEIDKKADAFIASFREQMRREWYQELQSRKLELCL